MAGLLDVDPQSGTGYLDNTLAVFERHKHPFILLGRLAKRWSGCRHDPSSEIDVLVRSSTLSQIVDELVACDWKLSKPVELGRVPNKTGIPEVWLKFRHEHLLFQYLRLWPEELCHLSLDCERIEVPDIDTHRPVLMEEEYDRDPYHRFLLPTRSRRLESELLPDLNLRAKSSRQDVPIYIPSIKAHLNALLKQRVAQVVTGRSNGGDPRSQLRDLIRYLVLDWEPTKEWILDTKIEGCLRETMELVFKDFARVPKAIWDREERLR